MEVMTAVIGTEHGDDRIHQRVGHADGVDAGLRRRDEERDGRPGRGALAAQREGGRQHPAGAEWQRRADCRSPQHRLDFAGAEQAREEPGRYDRGQHACQHKAEQQEDGSFLEDAPGFQRDAQQEIDHLRSRRLRRRAIRVPAAASTSTFSHHFGRYFLSRMHATEYCGSTTLAISSSAVCPSNCRASSLSNP